MYFIPNYLFLLICGLEALDFLKGIQTQLASIDVKLTALQNDVSAMREDVRRLTGKPVLEVYDEWVRKTVASFQGLQQNVFVEPSSCGPGENGDFKPDPIKNPATRCMKSFKEFMASAPKVADAAYDQVLLISGEAGSGKSTFVKKMTQYILTEYAPAKRRENITVILLPINLPALQDPVGSLFEQGAVQAFGFRQTQVDEFRSLFHDNSGSFELILLLDALDELSAAKSAVNLYRSNNLESLEPHKVVVVARSELFSSSKGTEHHRRFYPIESSNVNKDEESEAKAFFSEQARNSFRSYFATLSPFDMRNLTRFFFWQRLLNNSVGRDEFIMQHVALQLRDIFASFYPTIVNSPRPRNTGPLLSGFGRTVYEACTVESAQEQPDKDFQGNLAEWLKALDVKVLDESSASAFAVLACTAQLSVKDYVGPIKALIASNADVWMPQMYKNRFSEVPELAELTVTPFMLKVRTNTILRVYTSC